MKNALCLTLIFLGWYPCFAQSLTKTMARLPDTGQNRKYATVSGEDADYTINPPFFTVNGNGTVTDTVTGLMWQQTDGGEMTIESAALYCDTLTLGGYTDWRLPTGHESFSIFNHQNTNPALDATVFTATGAQYWWTGVRQAGDSTRMWVTNAGGGIGNHPKSEAVSAGGTKKIHVRAVRDPQLPPVISSHFTDNGDGTITDNLTNLIWEKAPPSTGLTWEQALARADTLHLAGKDDWRVPNIKELQSISDESAIRPSANTTYFTGVGVRKYWSSTTLPNQTTRAWFWDTQFGLTSYDLKTVANALICVRGGTTIASGITPQTPARPVTLILYPNPASGQIVLQLRDNGTADPLQVDMTDETGKMVCRKTPEGFTGVYTVDVQGLPCGMYMVRVTGKGLKISEKVQIYR